MPIKVGDRVKIVGNVSGSFIGEVGVVNCTSRKNLFGRQLIDVQLNPSQHSSCFYSNELEVQPVNRRSQMAKLPKGSSLKVVKTAGRDAGSYDLYDLRGLTLGKLDLIHTLVSLEANKGGVLAKEIVAAIGILDEHQTINGV